MNTPTPATVPDAYCSNYDGFEKDWISNSAMSLMMECGMAFRFKYIDKLPEARNVRLATGCATHKAREHNLSQKIATQTDLPVEECKDAARDDVNTTFESNEVRIEKEWEGKSQADARGIAVDLAVEMSETDRLVFQPEIQPATVEETIAVSYPSLSHIIVGKMDVRVENDEENDIRDLKTGKRAYGQSAADAEGGLTTYGLLRAATTGLKPDRYLIDNVVATGKSATKTNAYVTLRTDRQIQQQLERFALFMGLINKGAFGCCNPKHWRCSADWCGFHHLCPFAA